MLTGVVACRRAKIALRQRLGMLVHEKTVEEEMSRATYTRGSIGRSGKLLGLAALASLLVLSAA